MDTRTNQNYKIISTAKILSNDLEFVLGYNPSAPSKYVTWQCKNGNDYVLGHYFNDVNVAQDDLYKRARNELQYIKNKDMER